MLTEQRQEEIVKLVNERGSVAVQELVEFFQASESTIRRDITTLDKAGRLSKVFGGAMAKDEKISHKELSVSQKEDINTEEKRLIAEYAASLVEADDYVYLDAGTTTGSMIDYITERNAVYVTNAVAHAKKLAYKGFQVILIGGELKGSTEAIAGTEAVNNVRKYHFSKGFFGTNGIHPKTGFTTPDINEALLKQAAADNTQPGKRFVLAEHQKFGEITSVTFSGFDGTLILTDEMPCDDIWKGYQIKAVKESRFT